MAAITNNSVQNLLNILDGILLATVDIHHQLLPQSWLNCIDELCPILKSIFREDDISTEDISNGNHSLSYCIKVTIAIYNVYKVSRSDEHFSSLKNCLETIRYKLNI